MIIFYCLFGCAWEFAKCYLNKKKNPEDEDDQDEHNNSSIPYSNEYAQEDAHPDNHQKQQVEDQAEIHEKSKCKENTILAFIIFLGILCQPLYLILYMLYGLMECYRRFSCWFYYVDY